MSPEDAADNRDYIETIESKRPWEIDDDPNGGDGEDD